MTTVVVTPPAVEPISLTEAKLHLHVDTTDEDTLITALIVAAREMAENECGRKLITQTLDLYFDEFPSEFVILPIQSVTSVKYFDTDGVEQTLSSAQYVVDAKSEPARIHCKYGYYWPWTNPQPNAVTVRVTAGFGLAATVPQQIKQWMLLQIGHWYANREAAGAKLEAMPFIDVLIDPYRVVNYLP